MLKRVKPGFAILLPAAMFPGESNLFRCGAGAVIDTSHPFEEKLLKGQGHKLERLEGEAAEGVQATPITHPALVTAFMQWARRQKGESKRPIREAVADETSTAWALAKNKLSDIPEPDDAVVVAQVRTDRLERDRRDAKRYLDQAEAAVVAHDNAIETAKKAKAAAEERAAECKKKYDELNLEFEASVADGKRAIAADADAHAERQAEREKAAARKKELEARAADARAAFENAKAEAEGRVEQIKAKYADLITAVADEDVPVPEGSTLEEERQKKTLTLEAARDQEIQEQRSKDGPTLAQLEEAASVAHFKAT